jgi:hypothetical protein
MMITTTRVAMLAILALPLAASARQDPLTPEQRVAALKQSLADSQARLHKYEWIETTIISLKGEEKARSQKRCYYGADGKIQKLAIGEAPEPKAAPTGGRRGARLKAKIVENKKSDVQEYMERASVLIHQYVPPAPAQVQKVKDAGRLAITPLDQGRVGVQFTDYLQSGDRLTVVVNAKANNLDSLIVATYLDKPEDIVALDVRFATLEDRTSYTAQTTLDAKAKNIRVVVQNSGHRPLKQ